MNTRFEEILEYIKGLTIIDSHEHLPGREEFRENNTDILREYLIHYFSSDLIAMGLKREEMDYVRNVDKPLMERWDLVEPYWNLARNTGYGRALDLAATDIYGIPRIERNTLEELNTRFLETLKPDSGHFHRVLKEMSNIEYSVLDYDLNCDRKYFRSAYNIEGLVMPDNWSYIEKMENRNGIPVTSLEDWLEVCASEIEQAFIKGAITLKCALAYDRSLFFENVSRQEAENGFNILLKQKGRPVWSEGMIQTTKAFQDYMMHYILRIANRKGLVVQIHTGLQEGNNNFIANSDPTLLTNLFVQYTNVKFDIFHMGYPYQHTLSALAKLLPNVYLDMCWAHIISPAASISTLDEWLDSVPIGKIIAFGGDYILVDGVYAHQKMARYNISRVLADKVEEGIFDLDTVKWMAQRMLYENPKALYEKQ